ncbi:YopX family protein [Lentisphaerota bacterium WC36G]|nr:YopX family protein [Lentisphaerae bacterium WC36]
MKNNNLDRHLFRVWSEKHKYGFSHAFAIDDWGYKFFTHDRCRLTKSELEYYKFEWGTPWKISNKLDEKVQLFQGDIISKIYSEGFEIRHLIDWCDERGCFIHRNLPLDELNKGSHVTKEWLDYCKFKIIGNRYENPELLGGAE